ncbi:mechanosensitive ion channel family protein, partial [bacterium]|nr:mechanosensitive ion channel family protein [bacterium]
MTDNLELIQKLVILYGTKILLALMIVVIGKWLVKKIAKIVENTMNQNNVDPAIRNFVGSLVYWALLIFVCIA